MYHNYNVHDLYSMFLDPICFWTPPLHKYVSSEPIGLSYHSIALDYRGRFCTIISSS